MIATIRKLAKSWFAAGLLGILIVSFAIFGIGDVFRTMGSDTVIQAGGREVGSVEFRRQFDEMKEQAEQRAGQPITIEMAVERGMDRQMLEGLAGREAFAEMVRRMGVHVSDEQVAEEIKKIPAFFDQISGRFDQNLYASKLNERKFTPTTFEGLIRDEISQAQVMSAMALGLRLPRSYAAVGGAYALEARDISFFIVDPRGVEQPKPPTDAELQAFMKESAAQLTRPELRQITAVRFSAKAMEPTVTIDQAEVQKRFDFRKDSLAKPETRSLVQFPAKDAKAAAAIIQRLAAGADPAPGVEPVVYTDKPKTAIVDRKVAEAAFALKEGQVSQPIQGELGYAVVKVTKVTPAVTVSLEQVRPAIEAELRADAAAEKVYEQTKVYEDAHGAGANLVEAARKAGVQAVALPPVTAQGMAPNGQQLGIPEAILKTAFDLPQGGDSDIEEADKGEYYAVRVERVIPPAMPPLAEIKPQLTRVYMLRKMAERMQAKADQLAERVRKGESLEAVAASAGAQVKKVPGLSRVAAQQYAALGRDILVKSFGAKKGEVFVGQNPEFGYGVVRLDKIRPAPAADIAQTVEAQRPKLTRDLFADISRSIETYARRETKTRTNLDQARRALGIDPKELPGALGKKTEEPKT